MSMRIACVCLLAWQAAGGIGAGQPPFETRVAEFNARTQQFNAATTPEARALAALEWVRALKAVVRGILFDRVSPAERVWLDEHRPLVVYNAPGGLWLIRDEVIWRVHEYHKGTSAAEDIAWLAVENGLPGECEGFVPCYVSRLNRIEGEYLRREPQGKNRDEVLQRIARLLTIILDDLLTHRRANDFMSVPRDCADLLKSARPLREAVALVEHPETGHISKRLERLLDICRVEPTIRGEAK